MITASRQGLPQARLRREGGAGQALRERRGVWFAEAGFVSTPIYDRDRLPLDVELRGSCVVEQMDTTTVVPPQATLRVDALGCLHVEVVPTAPVATGRTAVRSPSGSSPG